MLRCSSPLRRADPRGESMADLHRNGGQPPRDGMLADLAAQLRALADRVDDLGPARVVGELEALKFTIWTAVVPSSSPTSLPVPPEQGALSQDEAAEAYHIPLRTLRRLTRTGRLPSYQLGRNRMIRPADLDHYLARCREQGVRVGTRLDTWSIYNE
jgi:excisionase family DNA binding protein